MPISVKDQQALANLHGRYSPSFGGVKEDYFAFMYLHRKFQAEPEDIAHQVAIGNHDFGIDAFYVDRKAGNLYLYQFKWTESHAQFKESMARLCDHGLPRVFGTAPLGTSENEVIRQLRAALAECRHLVEQVFIHFVFKGDVAAAEQSEGLANRREDIENRQHLLESYFGRTITLRVEFISDRPGVRAPGGSQTFEITIADTIELNAAEGRLLVGFASLMDLHRIHLALREKLFDRNIRSGLSPDNTPNKRLKSAFANIALQRRDAPEVFAFRHNGVTLAAERIERRQGRLLVHVPRLLNGAQTISTLSRFIEENVGAGNFGEAREVLERLQVLAKIVEADTSSDFVVDVTIANNQQNPVPPWSLRAMDRRQVDLADKFREELGIFYSRQEGAFENLTDEEREDLGIEETKDIRIRPLTQALLAAQGEIDKMSRLPEVFESASLYEATFKDAYSLPTTDSRKIVLAYKVGMVLNRPMSRLVEMAAAKHAQAIRRSRNLVWALLIQALLNEPHSDDLEEHGGSLAKSLRFRERLDALASSRVLPILRELLSMQVYAPKLEAGKYDFVRNKEAYKRCMDVAYKKWQWRRLPLELASITARAR